MDVDGWLINKNKLTFKSNLNVNFYCKDLTEYKDFDNFDFILMRDFFIHLPIPLIKKILTNLKNSNCRYFAFNNYENVNENDY